MNVLLLPSLHDDMMKDDVTMDDMTMDGYQLFYKCQSMWVPPVPGGLLPRTGVKVGRSTLSTWRYMMVRI